MLEDLDAAEEVNPLEKSYDSMRSDEVESKSPLSYLIKEPHYNIDSDGEPP